MDDTESQERVGNSDHFKFAPLTRWPDKFNPLNFWRFWGYNHLQCLILSNFVQFCKESFGGEKQSSQLLG